MTIKKIVLLLTEGPYSSPMLPQRLQVIHEILKETEEIIFFFYIDGIHQLNSDQLPRNFRNIGDFYANLQSKHQNLAFFACSRCTAARGYLDLQKSNIEANIFLSSKLLPFVEVVSIRKLGELLSKGYRIIQV